MKNALQEKGWSLNAHHLSGDEMAELVRKKNDFLEVSIREVEEAFQVSLKKFDAEKIEHFELAKGITRSLLRYDASSYLLAKKVWNELKETYGLSSELNFLSLPYPIIHFPLDTSEIGPKHKDGYDYIDHFYTTWTPLNDCFHKPISLTENTHRKNGFVLRQLRARVKFIDRLILSMKKTLFPDIKIGEFFVWHGSTEHEGLLNKVDFISTALVLRFTSSPILYEISLSCVDLEKLNLPKSEINTVVYAQKVIALFNEVNTQAKTFEQEKMSYPDLISRIETTIKEWKLSRGEAERFSFVLALWAQRLDGKRNVSLFYLYSYFVAHDNFYVLHKCINAMMNTFGKVEAEIFINATLKTESSIQMEYVVKSAISHLGEKAAGMKINLSNSSFILKQRFDS